MSAEWIEQQQALCDAATDGVDLIAAERLRQIEGEGYDPEHDAEHPEEMARAAACYAMPVGDRPFEYGVPLLWPWTPDYWKPTPDDRVRELVKAGALIAAEIDRLNVTRPSAARTSLPKALAALRAVLAIPPDGLPASDRDAWDKGFRSAVLVARRAILATLDEATS